MSLQVSQRSAGRLGGHSLGREALKGAWGRRDALQAAARLGPSGPRPRPDPPGAVRGDPKDTPPLSECPLIAVETTVVSFVDDGPELPMATLVEPRGMVKRRAGTSPREGGPGGSGRTGRPRSATLSFLETEARAAGVSPAPLRSWVRPGVLLVKDRL